MHQCNEIQIVEEAMFASRTIPLLFVTAIASIGCDTEEFEPYAEADTYEVPEQCVQFREQPSEEGLHMVEETQAWSLMNDSVSVGTLYATWRLWADGADNLRFVERVCTSATNLSRWIIAEARVNPPDETELVGQPQHAILDLNWQVTGAWSTVRTACGDETRVSPATLALAARYEIRGDQSRCVDECPLLTATEVSFFAPDGSWELTVSSEGTRVAGEGGEDQALELLRESGLSFTNEGFFAEIDAGNVENTRLFLSAGMNVNTLADYNGDTALIRAVRDSHDDLIVLLIEEGADVNLLNSVLGSSPIHEAINQNDEDCVSLLIKHEADVNIDIGGGWAPLHWAITQVSTPNIHVIRQLIEAGADVNATRSDGTPALVDALLNDQIEVGRLLIENGADVNVSYPSPTDLSATRALLADAIGWERYEFAVILVENGADVTFVDPNGYTLLMNAVIWNSLSLAQLLVENGADPNAQTETGRTAFDIAASNGYVEIEEYLRSQMTAPPQDVSTP